MQEKDIREKLNKELEEMAPDMLQKILDTPIEPIKSEKELFGKDRPLFKEKSNVIHYFKVPAIATLVAACFVALIMIMQPLFNFGGNQKQLAFSIVIDVNPSITIDVNDDGSVKKIKGGNKEGKAIANYTLSEMQDNDGYEKAINLVVKNLRKEGYLKKNKKNVMLVSAINKSSDNKEEAKKLDSEKLAQIKTETNEAIKIRKLKCKAVYQNVKVTKKIKKVATKNDVSLGKANLCIEISKEDNEKISTLCQSKISTLVDKSEHNKNIVIDTVEIAGEDFNTEPVTNGGETESVSDVQESVLMTEATTEMETQETVVEETTDSTPKETQIQIESTQVVTEETN